MHILSPKPPAGGGAFGVALRAAFRASIPVLLGYLSIGLAYGLVLVGSGLPWWLAPLSALAVYAGAAQFMGIGLLVSGAGILEIALLTLLMNARHMVYGLSMLGRYAGSGRRKPYLVFSLTDETYGLLTTIDPPRGVEPGSFYAAVSALNQSYWFIGCGLGALLGQALPMRIEGLDFALSALFTVLLVEQIKTLRAWEPYLAAALGAAFAYVAASPRDFLLVSLLAALGLLTLMRGRLDPISIQNGKALP
jgi:4-azaleucine resistance transporter AzlC